MRKCFIHIGTHKTGTTSIQQLLSSSNSLLQNHGYFYPQSGRPDLPGQHNLAWEISGDRRFSPHHGTIDDLLKEVECRSDDVILSSEDFECSLHHEPGFSDFVSLLQARGFTVVFVLYVRNQIDYLPRIYITLMLFEMDVAFGRVLKEILETSELRWHEWRFNFDYCDLLRRINQHENVKVIVRSFDAAQASLCSDFLSIFNLTLRDLNVDVEVVENVSLPLSDYIMMFVQHRIGRALTDDQKKALLNRVPRNARIDLSPGTKLALYQKFRHSNRELFLRYDIPEPHLDERSMVEGPETYYVDEVFCENIEAMIFATVDHGRD